MSKPVLGRGLGSLIPPKKSPTAEVLPEADKEAVGVSPHEIYPNPRQPRRFFAPEDLEDLVLSIREHGILLPLIVTRIANGYELIAGERRLRAAKLVGLPYVPVIIRDASEQQKLELALIENIQRQDLNALEEAFAYHALVQEFNLTQEAVAARVGKSRSAVANALRLLDLPEDMQGALRENKISKSHARTLLAEADPERRQQLFEAMLNGGMTVRSAESAVRKPGTSKARVIDPNLADHERKLREILGTKVEINEKDGKGSIVIDFYSREELWHLLEKLSS